MSPRFTSRGNMTPAERFEKYVVRNENDPADCWEWTSKRNMWYTAHNGNLIHCPQRYIFDTQVRPVKPNERIIAMCGNPECVNPEHLHGADPLLPAGTIAAYSCTNLEPVEQVVMVELTHTSISPRDLAKHHGIPLTRVYAILQANYSRLPQHRQPGKTSTFRS